MGISISENMLRRIVERLRSIPPQSFGGGSAADRSGFDSGFWARITAVDSSGKHSWKMVRFDSSAADHFSDWSPEVIGEANAVMVGGGTGNVGSVVRLRLAGYAEDGKSILYVFDRDDSSAQFHVEANGSAAGEYIGQIVSPFTASARAILPDEADYGTHVLAIGTYRSGRVIGEEPDGEEGGGTRKIVLLDREWPILSSTWCVVTADGPADQIYYGTMSLLAKGYDTPAAVSGSSPALVPVVIYNTAETPETGRLLGPGSIVQGTIIGSIDNESPEMNSAYVVAVFAPERKNFKGDDKWVEVQTIEPEDDDFDEEDPAKKRIAHIGPDTASQTTSNMLTSHVATNKSTITLGNVDLKIDGNGHVAPIAGADVVLGGDGHFEWETRFSGEQPIGGNLMLKGPLDGSWGISTHVSYADQTLTFYELQFDEAGLFYGTGSSVLSIDLGELVHQATGASSSELWPASVSGNTITFHHIVRDVFGHALYLGTSSQTITVATGSDISALWTAVNAVGQNYVDWGTYNNAVPPLASTVSTLSSTVAGHTSEIATIGGAINTLDQLVAACATQIALQAQADRITQLNSDLTALMGRVAALEGAGTITVLTGASISCVNDQVTLTTTEGTAKAGS